MYEDCIRRSAVNWEAALNFYFQLVIALFAILVVSPSTYSAEADDQLSLALGGEILGSKIGAWELRKSQTNCSVSAPPKHRLIIDETGQTQHIATPESNLTFSTSIEGGITVDISHILSLSGDYLDGAELEAWRIGSQTLEWRMSDGTLSLQEYNTKEIFPFFNSNTLVLTSSFSNPNLEIIDFYDATDLDSAMAELHTEHCPADANFQTPVWTEFWGTAILLASAEKRRAAPFTEQTSCANDKRFCDLKSASSCSTDSALCSNQEICNRAAITSPSGERSWRNSDLARQYLEEAYRRGLGCGVTDEKQETARNSENGLVLYQQILDVDELKLRTKLLERFLTNNSDQVLFEAALEEYLQPFRLDSETTLEDLELLNEIYTQMPSSSTLHEYVVSAEHSGYLAELYDNYLSQRLKYLRAQSQNSVEEITFDDGSVFYPSSSSFPTFGRYHLGPISVFGYWNDQRKLDEGIATFSIGALTITAGLQRNSLDPNLYSDIADFGEFRGPVSIKGDFADFRFNIATGFINSNEINGLFYSNLETIYDTLKSDELVGKVISDTGFPVVYSQIIKGFPDNGIIFSFKNFSCDFDFDTMKFRDDGSCILSAEDRETIIIDKLDVREFVNEGLGAVPIFAPMVSKFLNDFRTKGFKAAESLVF